MQYSQPNSYWQTTLDNTLAPDAAPQYDHELPQQADAVVIGGGIHGACALYCLVRAGLTAVMIERELPAAGATGRNGGLCVVGPGASYAVLADQGNRALARRITADTLAGYRALRAMIETEGIAAMLRPNGHVTLALNDADFAAMKRTATLMAEDGFGARMLTRAEIGAYARASLAHGVVGGKLIVDAAQLHSGRLVLGVVRAAQRLGARVILGQPEFDLPRMRVGAGGSWVAVSAICACVNAWTRDVLPGMPITPVRGQALSYAPSAPVFDAGFGAGVTETGEYWQQLPTGEIVIGGCRALAPSRDVDVHGFDVDAKVQAGIEGVLPSLFPDLRGLRVERRWSGTMGFTPDHNPIFDKHPDFPLFYTGGFSGHGMPFAMTFGEWLAQSVQRGAAVEPSGIYARDRFS